MDIEYIYTYIDPIPIESNSDPIKALIFLFYFET